MKRRQGQAVLEYLLMVLMLAVTVAVIFRGINRQFVYELWTGLARQIALPCPDCKSPAAPQLP